MLIRIMLLAILFAVAPLASAQQIVVMDPPSDLLTTEQIRAISAKSAVKAKAECFNRYTAAAALAGATVGNLVTRPGSLLRPGPLLAIALVIWAGIEIHDAIVAEKVRADCAAAGAAAGFAVAYAYFLRVYRDAEAAKAAAETVVPFVPESGPGPIPG